MPQQADKLMINSSTHRQESFSGSDFHKNLNVLSLRITHTLCMSRRDRHVICVLNYE